MGGCSDVSAADTVIDVLPTWTFEREGEQLTLQRQAADALQALIVSAGGTTRTFQFPDLPALVVFQTDMEAFLMRTGWLLRSYAPDRRKRDRRQFPRTSVDRRRWWTDGVTDAFNSVTERRSRRSSPKA